MLKLCRMPSGEPEIFASIQGEGITAGMPSTFVRLSLCNLSCSFCDTAYSWDWQRYNPKTEIMILEDEDVLTRIEALGGHNVVITGGEPLLQQSSLAPLLWALKERDYRLEVETNGTILPSPIMAEVVDQWNVSPKLATSANTEQKRTVPEVLGWFAQHPRAYFKFVITEPDDIDEVKMLIEQHVMLPRRVLLMAEGADPAIQLRRSRWLVPICIERGYRYTPRLHVLLWGDERGR